MTKHIHYFEILIFKAMAELKAECGRTWGGAIWWFVDPLLSILIYYVAFGLILQIQKENFVPFLCVGIVMWRWFQCSVMRGASSILRERGLMDKVYMPKILFPSISLLADLIKFCIMFCILLGFLLFLGVPPNITYFALPILLLVQLVFLAAIVGFLSACVPFFPDLQNMLSHGLHLMFFLSGVLFSIDRAPPWLRKVIYLNPMAGLIRDFRKVLIDGAWPDWTYLVTVFLFSMLGLLGVVCLLMRFDKIYPKYS